MPVRYYLRKNAISSNPTSHKAIIVPYKINNVSDIISEMLKRGTTLSEADILASLHLFFEVVNEEVQEGNHVNLPIANLKPGISGEFYGSSDQFDSSRHKIKATASIGSVTKKIMKEVVTEKITKPLTVPILTAFKDVHTQNLNSVISPGSIGQIIGNHLKYNPENANEGIFFVSDNEQEFKVNTVATRTLGKLAFIIPQLPSGAYTLIVKRAFGKSEATLRNGSLSFLLKVD